MIRFLCDIHYIYIKLTPLVPTYTVIMILRIL